MILKEKTLVFIPAYNCEKQIIRVLKNFNSEILEYIDEIIVVNNRSTDNTEQTIFEYITQHQELPVTLLTNLENYGLGGSHKVAFRYAVLNKYDFIIVLHGDDQGEIRDILPILKEKKHQAYDCCLGARFKNGSRLIGYSRFRTFGNRIFNLIYSLATGMCVYDLGAGLNIYNTQMLQNEFYFRFADNLTFNCFMLLAASNYRHKIWFFPVTWKEEDQISNVKMFRQACEIFKIALKYLSLRRRFLEAEQREISKEKYTSKIIFDYRSKQV